MIRIREIINSFFKIIERKSSIKTEIIAGITSFVVIAYIIIVNPTLISHNGLSPELASALFISTCISSALGCFFMGLYANAPYILAPGMGMNGYFAFTAMPALALAVGDPNMDIIVQYQMACAVVFISGILLVIISFTKLRKFILDSIPRNLRDAMVSGLGLFIAFLGLKNAGIIISTSQNSMEIVNFLDPEKGTIAIISMIGIVVLAILASRKVKGACIYSILVICIISFLTGNISFSGIEENILSESISNFFSISFLQLDFATLFSAINIDVVLNTFVVLTISLTLTDFFDSAATFYSIDKLTDVKNDDEIKLKKAFICDSFGTLIGALLGSSSVTTYVESTVGVSEGGRTGLTAITAGILFIMAIFCMPIFVVIPVYASAPTLIYAGMLFLKKNSISFQDDDLTELLPALLTLLIIPFSGNVTDGLAFGLIAYVILKLATGKISKINPVSIIIAAIFLIQYIAVI